MSGPVASRGAGTPPAEWAAAALGGLILLGMTGFLIHAGLAADGDAPPRIEASVLRVEPAPGGQVAVVVARNLGPAAATAVRLRGTLGDETSVVEFDHLAQYGERRGGLFFSLPPGGPLPVLRVEGYAAP